MELTPTCPAASVIASGPKGQPGIKCGVMERDQARADRILEGTPIGVVLSAVDDTRQVFGFCCGADPAPADREEAYRRAETGEARLPCSYTCCPVWMAAEEWDAGLSRLYGAPERPELPEDSGSVKVGREAAEDDEIRDLFGLEAFR